MTQRFGSIQREILAHIDQGPERGAFIGSTSKFDVYRGLDWEQVERSLRALESRGIIRKEGIRWLRT